MSADPAVRPRRHPVGGLWGAGLLLALAVSVVATVATGPADLSFGDVWSAILSHVGGVPSPLARIEDAIVWELRLPRVLTAAMVGAGLAMAGVVMQAITRNPLADPYLLGLSSGAALGAVAVLVLGVGLLLPAAAFAGALAALAATLAIARAAGGLTPSRTVLAGIAVSSLGAALTSFVIFWTATGDSYREIISWLLGSLAGADWTTVAISATALTVVGIPLLLSARRLDAFTFGDTAASALGVHVERSRRLLLAGAALLTGAMVAVSGSIGFVGLVLPHVVRLAVGSGHRLLLPLSGLAGAVFLIWCDTAARTVFDPRELPVGVVTAILGTPVFVALLVRPRGVS